MGDSGIVAGSPRHASDRRQMVARDRPNCDAHRLRFDLADRGRQLSGAPHQVARFGRPTAREATEYLLLSKRARQVFETDACVVMSAGRRYPG
jgi:hypothetical protein